MELLFFVLYLVNLISGQQTPYTWIDFDYIHQNDIWENRNVVRAQDAGDGTVFIDGTFPISQVNDNNGDPVGVFACNNQLNGNPWTTPNTVAYLPPLTYNEFTLEVIVKPKSNDIISKGYIIGIEGTMDNTEGDAIAYNAITGKTSGESNKFFAANIRNNGWHATTQYWDSTQNTNDIDNTKFHHVIVTQDVAGLVSVYVNGLQYGSSYAAPGGVKANNLVFANIKICGDDHGNVGFDGDIRAFGFYTKSFDSDDAHLACEEASLDTSVTCLEPIPPCTLGGNPGYFIEGFPAYVSGDPHFRLWNGNRHDFMGRGNPNQQFYYMHPCKGFTRDEMPFTILGKHQRVGSSSITGLDYITLELFDLNGDQYLVWLSSTIASWTKRTPPTTNTLYDFNPGTNILPNVQLNIGHRFKVKYTKTGSRMNFILTIGDCTLELSMSSQGNVINGRPTMHYLQIKPPQCYKCYTCGLLGDFFRPSTGAVVERMRTCNNGYVAYRSGWSTTITEAFDINGWTWEKNYVANKCPYWNTRRRLQDNSEDGGEYTPQIDPDFKYIDPCDPTIRNEIIGECALARDVVSDCCDIIGGGYCDKLQTDCEIDACALVTQGNDMEDAIKQIMIDPVELVCSMPDASTQLDPDNLVPAPGAPLWIGAFDLILRLKDVSTGYFSNTISETGVENENNIDANAYSIIGNIHNPTQYLGSDGKYEFLLQLTFCDDTTAELHWKQSSWLTVDGDALGFEPIDIPTEERFQISSSCVDFIGLSLANANVLTFLDGVTSTGCWWNSVGTIRGFTWNDCTGIPSFNMQIAVSQSLYIKVQNTMKQVPL